MGEWSDSTHFGPGRRRRVWEPEAVLLVEVKAMLDQKLC